MRKLGVDVQVISTSRPPKKDLCHSHLNAESENAFYAWPPKLSFILSRFLKNPSGILSSIHYLNSLDESNFFARVRLFPIMIAGAGLAEHCSRRGIKHILVHSCADAAHLVNFSRIFQGPSFSLRVGGDLRVYGVDHEPKMKFAKVVFPAAKNNEDEVIEVAGVPKDRLYTTSLGVDTSRFIPNASKHSRSQEKGLFHIVTVARLNRAKGHEHALDAIAMLRSRGVGIRYTIAGSGPYESEIRKRVEELDLGDVVRFSGAIDEEAVIRHLQDSDIFVLPSVGLGEAAPVAVLEAMSCGVAVICSQIGGTADLIDDGVDGFLVPPAKSQAIADTIERLVTHPDELHRVSKAARERAIRDFEVQDVAARMICQINKHVY